MVDSGGTPLCSFRKAERTGSKISYSFVSCCLLLKKLFPHVNREKKYLGYLHQHR